MPRVGFESTTPVFERAKTVHVLDRAATVIGKAKNRCLKFVLVRTCENCGMLGSDKEQSTLYSTYLRFPTFLEILWGTRPCIVANKGTEYYPQP
jgi:hypothetical protein